MLEEFSLFTNSEKSSIYNLSIKDESFDYYINNRDYYILDTNRFTFILIRMKRQCVRCGVHLTEDRKLWCKKCRERVDEELRGEISRPYEYYFRWHLRHKK